MLFNMWYIDGVKVVPFDIFNLLSPIALAHWIMGDGCLLSGGGMYLCTDSFTVSDVVKLMNVLLVRYDIPSTLHYSNGLPRIYIKKADMYRVRAVVGPYIIPSMLYKIKV